MSNKKWKMGQIFWALHILDHIFWSYKYYLFNFRESKKVEVELSADFAQQTGTIKPSGECTTEYAEKTLEQKPRLDEVKLPPHSSGRKLQVPILPNIFSCNI